jgi:hypothetical protein
MAFMYPCVTTHVDSPFSIGKKLSFLQKMACTAVFKRNM